MPASVICWIAHGPETRNAVLSSTNCGMAFEASMLTLSASSSASQAIFSPPWMVSSEPTVTFPESQPPWALVPKMPPP